MFIGKEVEGKWLWHRWQWECFQICTFLIIFIYKSVYNIKYIQYIHLLITYLQIKSLFAVALSPLWVFVSLHYMTILWLKLKWVLKRFIQNVFSFIYRGATQYHHAIKYWQPCDFTQQAPFTQCTLTCIMCRCHPYAEFCTECQEHWRKQQMTRLSSQ